MGTDQNTDQHHSQQTWQLHFIAEGIELDSFENIADNRNVLYEVPVNSEFNPFPFLSEPEKDLESFANDDQSDLPDFSRNHEDRIIHQIKTMGTDQNADQYHPQQTWQFYF